MLVSITLLGLALSMNAGGCNADQQALGLCSISSDVGAGVIDVRGIYESDDRDGTGGSYDSKSNTDDGDSEECTSPLGRCETYEVVMRQEATLSDIASFAPTLTPLAPEPDGVGVVGLPVNIVATAATHTRSGELFDLPVTVRFRPVSFTFDYGDGQTREASDGGATWARLGLPQFTATDTSHAYSARGSYRVTAAVRYAADVDFGTGWIPVDGLLAVPAGATTVRILEARTALVERTCIEDPAGIGC